MLKPYYSYIKIKMLKICCAQLEIQGLKIAFIESASAGYLATQFALYKNCGANILLGGLVCYAPWVKQKILSLSKEFIQKYKQNPKKSLKRWQSLANAYFIKQILSLHVQVY